MVHRSTTLRAQRLRNAAPSSEVLLWKAIRHGRLGGLKFRRQYPVGGYFADFACVGARLVIELDGPSHQDDEQAAYDARRTADLEAAGWFVLRFTNDSLRAGLQAVVASIEDAARPTLSSAETPLPPRGPAAQCASGARAPLHPQGEGQAPEPPPAATSTRP